MKLTGTAALLSVALCSPALAQEHPHAQIANRQLNVKLYLPDAKTGFYTATRFDWSGAIYDLTYAGHHLYRPWFVAVDPAVRDVSFDNDRVSVGPNSAMTGPAEEFSKPVGYDTAKAGESFLKVGVGLLRKVDDTPYAFSKAFPLVDAGSWKSTTTARSVTSTQTLGSAGSDYGYVYTKTVRLDGDRAVMVIEHTLRNTGRLPISTNVYDHNFLTDDAAPTGPAYSIHTTYAIQPQRLPDAKFVTVDGTAATYIADVTGSNRVAFGLQGYGAAAKDYDFRVDNSSTNVSVRVQGDKPLSNAVVWSIRSIVAVEPFIDIVAEPGKSFTWSYTYTYSAAK